MINFFLPKIISIDHCLVLEIDAEGRVHVVWESHAYWEESRKDDDPPTAYTSDFSVQDEVFEFVLVEDLWKGLNPLLGLQWVLVESLFFAFRRVILKSIHKVSYIAAFLGIVSLSRVKMILVYDIRDCFLNL